MGNRMKNLLAMASLTMAMASVGEPPVRVSRKSPYAPTNKDKKKCKSCAHFGKIGDRCYCKLNVRSMTYMEPMKSACENYKKRKR